MSVLDFQDRLHEQLAVGVPTYNVQLMEPTPTQLQPGQIWIASDTIEPGNDIASLGETIAVSIPVYVSTVMSVATSPEESRAVLIRRLRIIQAIQRAIRDYVPPNGAIVRYVGEAGVISDDLYVSTAQITVEYQLPAEGEPQ